MKIKIKRMHPEAKLPARGHTNDAGLDVHALQDYVINPGEHSIIWNGFALEIPEGYTAIVKDKSSISKAGLHTMGGVFDAGYRGEYNVHLVNLSKETYTIEKGDKVAQLVILPVMLVEIEEVETLSQSSRGSNGFGSTGKK